jgi:anti-sigma factor RsiW
MTVPHATPPREVVCREVVELVTRYLEGVLPPDERAAVGRHLQACDGCQAYLEQLRLTIRAVSRVSDDATTSQTRAGVLAIFRAWCQTRTSP